MEPVRIGCCITAHGLGHAARACAVMEALHERAAVHFEIAGALDPAFLEESLRCSWLLHRLETDVGLVQQTPLHEDLDTTIERLASLYPPPASFVKRLADCFRGCSLVFCDIAPLGLAAARRAGAVSVLVENFTWDWIYEGYLQQAPGLRPYIRLLRDLARSADYHVRAEPACCHGGDCDLLVPPVSRGLRSSSAETRAALGIHGEETMILLTMGGVQTVNGQDDRLFLVDKLRVRSDMVFVLPGGGDEQRRLGNCVLLPGWGGFYHPDLVAASDAVVGKLGYSTLAEVYQAGVPYGYIGRPRFRESACLAAFVSRQMTGLDLTEAWQRGDWPALLPDLVLAGKTAGKKSAMDNGAGKVADFLLQIMHAARVPAD